MRTLLLLPLILLTLSVQAADKIVFLGDSITRNDTYPRLVAQALKDAGQDPPVCINSGINGDTAAGMLKRFDRDVLAHKPTMMTLSAGINDSRLKVSDEDYEKTITAIVDRAEKNDIKVVILTTTILGKGREDRAARTEKYDAILRKVAAAHQAPVADVKSVMSAAAEKGESLLDQDQVHPNFAGHRLIARALLDALGHKDVHVPAGLKP